MNKISIDKVKYLNNIIDILYIKQDFDKDNNIENPGYSGPEISDFINKELFNTKNIFVKDDHVIPFKLYKEYLIVSNNDEYINLLIDSLNTINCDLSKLKTLNITEMMNSDFLNKKESFFIINSNYCIIEK